MSKVLEPDGVRQHHSGGIDAISMQPVRPRTPKNDEGTRGWVRAPQPCGRRRRLSGMAVSGNGYLYGKMKGEVVREGKRRDVVQGLIHDEVTDEEFLAVVEGGCAAERGVCLKELLFQFKRAKGFVSVSQELSLHDLYTYIVGATTHQLRCENAVLHIYDPVGKVLYHPLSPSTRVLPTTGLAKRVITKKKKIHVSFGCGTTRVREDLTLFGRDCDTALAVPLVRQNSTTPVIGMLTAINKSAHTHGGACVFTDVDHALLEALAQQASASLSAALDRKELDDVRQQFTSFLESSSCFEARPSLEGSEGAKDAFVYMLNGHLKKFLNAERCCLFLFDPMNPSTLCCILPDGTTVNVPSKGGVLGEVIESKKIVNITAAYSDPRFSTELDRMTGYDTQTLLSVPVLGHDAAPLGVLEVLNKDAGQCFTELDELIATAFSTQISFILQHNVALGKQQKDMAAITGILSGASVMCVVMDDALRGLSAHGLGLNNPLHVTPEDVLGVHISKWLADDRMLRNSLFLSSVSEVVRSGSLHSACYNLQVSKTETKLIKYVTLPLQGATYGLFISALDDSTVQAAMMLRNTTNDVSSCDVLSEGARVSKGTVVTIYYDYTKYYSDAAVLFKKKAELVAAVRGQAKRYSGVVTRWQGSNVVVVFGVPFPKSTDAVDAVMLACDLLNACSLVLAPSSACETLHIGVHSGTLQCGAVGDTYDCVGHDADISESVAAAAHNYRATILVSCSTLAQLGSSFWVRHIDKVTFAESSQVHSLCEILGRSSVPITPLQDQLRLRHTEALDSYRHRNWHNAISLFSCSAETCKDPVAEVFLLRCLRLRDEPPTAKWNGVWPLKRQMGW